MDEDPLSLALLDNDISDSSMIKEIAFGGGHVLFAKIPILWRPSFPSASCHCAISEHVLTGRKEKSTTIGDLPTIIHSAC